MRSLEKDNGGLHMFAVQGGDACSMLEKLRGDKTDWNLSLNFPSDSIHKKPVLYLRSGNTVIYLEVRPLRALPKR